MFGATVLGATVLASGSAPAGAAPTVDEYYPVPAAGLTITGHGFGHGRGMSQYGAQGAALQGVGYRDILARYYPGTVAGPLPAPSTVRVLIGEDDDDDLTVRADPGLALSDADGARWVLPAGPRAWRITADSSGAQHVQYDDGAWHPWTAPGGRTSFTELRVEGPSRVRVDLPGGGGRAYRGTVTAARAGGSALSTVDTLPFEQYLWGVVPREAISSWLPAALQAQAVAARTYSASLRASSAGRAYDICDSTACQVYGGSASYGPSGTLVEQEPASTTAAVNATAGEVRLYGGRPAFTEFSASSGGWTTSGNVPYLVAGPDPWDDFAGNPVHTWTRVLTPAVLAAAFPTVGTVTRLHVTGRDGGGEGGGRITGLVVEGVSPTGAPLSTSVSGATFASRLGLRSSWWLAPSVSAGTPVLEHWQALGGAASFLGVPTSDEYDVPGGRAQDFAGGRIYWSAALGAHEVHGDILARWLGTGGPGGPYGMPTADETAVPGGRAGLFEGGNVYWSYATGPQAVHGEVLSAYLALGGPASRFGLPLDEEQPQGPGLRERFAGGSFYWSAATGAQPVEGAVLAQYVVLGEAAGPLGLPVAGEEAAPGGRLSRFAYGRVYWSPTTGAHEVYGAILGSYLAAGGADGRLGLPTTGEVGAAGGRQEGFAGGGVYWSSTTGAHLVVGAILDEYRGLGEGGSVVGWPVLEEAPVPNGLVERFSAGDVYFSATTWAHEVHGAIRAEYGLLGGPGGLLGLPVGDERAVPGGRASAFAGGQVFWTPAGGPHEVHGAILAAYLSRGATASPLGAPVSDEYAVPGGRRNDFASGALVWRAATNDVVVVPR